MQKFDLFVSQGSTFLCGVTVQNDDGTPYNLTNFTAQAYLNTRYGNTGGFISLNPQITNAVSGQMTLSMDSGITSGLPVTILAYDLMLIATTGDIALKPLWGNVSVFPAITAPYVEEFV